MRVFGKAMMTVLAVGVACGNNDEGGGGHESCASETWAQDNGTGGTGELDLCVAYQVTPDSRLSGLQSGFVLECEGAQEGSVHRVEAVACELPNPPCDPGSSADECESSSQCPAGECCVMDAVVGGCACVSACRLDSDCAADEACLCRSGFPEEGVPPGPGAYWGTSVGLTRCHAGDCRTDADCPEGFLCGLSGSLSCPVVPELHCHGPEDECQAQIDCEESGAGGNCLYSRSEGRWICTHEEIC
jgi:hypothetical protein